MWNVIRLQIMSHMLFFRLVIPGFFLCGLLPKQCLSALDKTRLHEVRRGVQVASRVATGKSGLHGRGKGECITALKSG